MKSILKFFISMFNDEGFQKRKQIKYKGYYTTKSWLGGEPIYQVEDTKEGYVLLQDICDSGEPKQFSLSIDEFLEKYAELPNDKKIISTNRLFIRKDLDPFLDDKLVYVKWGKDPDEIIYKTAFDGYDLDICTDIKYMSLRDLFVNYVALDQSIQIGGDYCRAINFRKGKSTHHVVDVNDGLVHYTKGNYCKAESINIFYKKYVRVGGLK